MTGREKLPDRRPHEIVEFNHAGFRFTAGIGRYRDGRIAEVFLSSTKSGTLLGALCHDAAIVLSLALQGGVDPHTLRHAVGRESDGSPATAIGRLLDLVIDGEGQR